MNWIKCSEILPQNNKTVLIRISYSESNEEYIVPARLNDKNIWQELSGCCQQFHHEQYVTHWMPLPEKPKD